MIQRTADIDHAVHLGTDRVLDFLVEGEAPGHERLAVEPDGEAGGGEVGVQALHERLVIATGVGEEDAGGRCRRQGGHDSFFTACDRGIPTVFPQGWQTNIRWRSWFPPIVTTWQLGRVRFCLVLSDRIMHIPSGLSSPQVPGRRGERKS